jgi:hypothetical protein
MMLAFRISSVKENMEPVQCSCGLTTPIITSMTIKSHRRQFYGYAMYDHKMVFVTG